MTSHEASVEREALFTPSVVHFISGGIAGCVAKSAIAPLDRVKILFQTNSPHYSFKNVFNAMKNITESEGLIKLWKGNSATLIRIFPYAAIQFTVYEKLKTILVHPSSEKKAKPVMHSICGAAAGASATIFTYPFDLIRARMASEVHTSRYEGPFQGLLDMYRSEGIRAWTKGMIPTLQGIIPYAGVNFATYETLLTVAPRKDSGEIHPVTRLLCGGLAGAVGQTVSYPWDVIRRRMQTAGFAPGVKDIVYTGSWSTMREIVRTEGFAALFRGISINFWKVCPAVGISFTTYEYVKTYLGSL